MQLPNFLIIGAMKSATTGLYRDLDANPRIYFPSIKEVSCLTNERVLRDEGRTEYEAFFQDAAPDQIRGEGSTDYTKIPDIPGVPKRARQVLGAETKLVYMVREPVARTISHHYHLYREDRAPLDINEAVRNQPELINYSRYAMQLEPWLEEFDQENLLVVRMEDYASNRLDTVGQVSIFLGVDPRPDLIEVDKRFNDGKTASGDVGTIFQKPINAIRGWSFYRTQIHPRTPAFLREALKKPFVRKNRPKPPPPTPETVGRIIDAVREDVEQLRQIMGRDEPVWDLPSVLNRFVEAKGD